METMKGLARILGVAALMAVVAACGDNSGPTAPRDQATPTVAATSPTEPDPPPIASIDHALAAAEGSEVTARGFLIDDTDGCVRLCSVLLESYPPQCGGDRIEFLKFDADSVPNSETPGAPGQIATARWTNSPITVTGVRSSRSGSAALIEVRILAEDSETHQGANQPAPTATVPPVTLTPVLPAPTVTVPPTTAIDSDSEAVTGYDILIADLRNAGATTVEATGPLTQYGFSVGGRRAVVNGGAVHVFEFPSASDVEASFISADGWTMSVPSEGGSVRETNYEWLGTPHFHKRGALIVVYNDSQYAGIGDASSVTDMLERVLGPPFAGGPVTPRVTPAGAVTPAPTPARELALSVLERQCTASHTTKIPSSPGLLCAAEVPNLTIYSDGFVIYHVWERAQYGSRIGGELLMGQLTPEALDEVLSGFEEAGVFSVQGPPDARGDAAYYVISASFGGRDVSLILSPAVSGMPLTQEEAQLAEFIKPYLDSEEWSAARSGFQELGVYDPPSIRLIVQRAFAPATDEWPLPEIALDDGLTLVGEELEAVQALVPLGWFRHYRHDGEDYVVGYAPELPQGWP